jgi:hypothetical protein
MARKILNVFFGFEELKQTIHYKKPPVRFFVRGGIWFGFLVCSFFVYQGWIALPPLLAFPLFLLTVVSTFVWIFGAFIVLLCVHIFPSFDSHPQRRSRQNITSVPT